MSQARTGMNKKHGERFRCLFGIVIAPYNLKLLQFSVTFSGSLGFSWLSSPSSPPGFPLPSLQLAEICTYGVSQIFAFFLQTLRVQPDKVAKQLAVWCLDVQLRHRSAASS